MPQPPWDDGDGTDGSAEFVPAPRSPSALPQAPTASPVVPDVPTPAPDAPVHAPFAHVQVPPAPPPPTGHPASLTADPVTHAAPAPPSAAPEPSATTPDGLSARPGRHSAPDAPAARRATSSARVLLLAGAEPLSGAVMARLSQSGHRLAVADPAAPAATGMSPNHHAEPPAGFPVPVMLAGDRTDAEAMVGLAAAAEVALSGLDAVVILPAGPGGRRVGLDADPETWIDAWSNALTSDVLAVGCVALSVARLVGKGEHPGRIVLVADGEQRPTRESARFPGGAIPAAVTALAADLARALEPLRVGVSVVTAGPEVAPADRGRHIAELVDAVLSTPALSGVDVRIG